jgi:hypothetical protein
LGSRSFDGGTIHAAGCPSTFGASWPAFTSSLKASLVAVERGHGSGSITVMGCWRAMRISEGARRRSERWAEAKGRAVLWNESEESGSNGREVLR